MLDSLIIITNFGSSGSSSVSPSLQSHTAATDQHHPLAFIAVLSLKEPRRLDQNHLTLYAFVVNMRKPATEASPLKKTGTWHHFSAYE